MALSKHDARAAVEIGALSTGSFAFAFPRAAAAFYGADRDNATTQSLMRMLGARSIAYGTVLMHLDDDDDVELALIAAAASSSADCLAAFVSAARGKRRWPGALATAVIGGTIAGLACWSLSE